MTERRHRSIACSPEEWAEVRYRATQSEMSISAFLIKRALQGGASQSARAGKMTPSEERDCYEKIMHLNEEMGNQMEKHKQPTGVTLPEMLDFIYHKLREDMLRQGRTDEIASFVDLVMDQREKRLQQLKNERDRQYNDEHYI